MKESIIKLLTDIVGTDYVLYDAEQIESYMYDQVEAVFRPKAAMTSVVVKPKSSAEISKIMKLASENVIPVVVRGGGTGLCGAATPTHESIVICMERMNKVIEIDEANMMAVLEAGVTLGELLEELEKHDGIGFPVHPGDEGAQMGGMVINNAGGARAVRHGITRNHVKGLEIVTADGEIITLGGKLLKDNAGYNLMQIIMGSEGTLAIVTKVILRLYPEEKYSASIVVAFEEIENASKAVLEIIKRDVNPLAVEYQDRWQNLETAKMLGLKWPLTEGKADLIIILSDATENMLYENCRIVNDICREYHAKQAVFAGTKEEQAEVLAIRSGSYDVIKDEIYHSFDMAVPPGYMPDFLNDLWALVRKYDTKTNITAHIADGNVHNDIVLVDGKVPDYSETLKNEMYGLCFRYGGTITGEHGIGKLRVDDLKLQKTSKELEIMRGIKKAFDPLGILNPDTVFRTEG